MCCMPVCDHVTPGQGLQRPRAGQEVMAWPKTKAARQAAASTAFQNTQGSSRAVKAGQDELHTFVAACSVVAF